MWDWLINHVTSGAVLLMFGAFAVITLVEMAFPARPGKRELWNLPFAITNSFLALALAPASAWIATTTINALGIGILDLRSWGAGGPVVVMLLGVVAMDLAYYWYHRLQHAWQPLWRLHAVHHSDTHMCVLTTSRAHVIEQLIWPVTVTLPAAILFKLPPQDIALLALIPLANDYWVHANVRCSYGPLWWLLASPQHHRIHHSIEPEHLHCNYAARLPFIDLLFGTAYRARPGEYPASGVVDYRLHSVTDAYTRPFRDWAHALKRKWPSGC